MPLELTVRHGTVPVPELKIRAPSPTFTPRFQRQTSENPISPTDTPRKNKRKLNEPKRRTTDFSIKRLCPGSPGSACSESGRSEESTPERIHEDSRDSVEIDGHSGLVCDMFNPHLRSPFVLPELRRHPVFIPQFYYNTRYSAGLPVGGPPLPEPNFQGIVHTGNSLEHSIHLNVPSIKLRHNLNSTDDTLSKHILVQSNVTSPSNFNQTLSKETIGHARASLPKPNKNDEDDDDDDDESSPESPISGKKGRTNYKNMTRERRVEANARERSRVHTISAAFDGLRRAVPSYSYDQKLSKLAILRIACSYINALTTLADTDDGVSQLRNISFAQCVDKCTRTIQTEGRARRRH